MDNAKYHCTFIEKTPTMNIKTDEMTVFILNCDIEIPNPIPRKSVILEKILIIFKNIEKQYVIDSMAEKGGYSVLRLPPYHCILSPIESIKILHSSLECVYK